MSSKEKALLWLALAFGAALFFGAIIEGVKHSVKHGTTYPTRTEFNAVIKQHRQWDIKQDSILHVLRTEINRIKNENSK